MPTDKKPTSLATETMAQLLLSQRHWREAIDIYLELARKEPEKASAYQKKVDEIKEFFELLENRCHLDTGDALVCTNVYQPGESPLL